MPKIKSELAENTKYYVTSWVTGRVIQECDTLAEAKKVARAQGHDTWNKWHGYAPMAYVAADVRDWDFTKEVWGIARVLVYNPRFKG